ncbi:Os11g0471100, partial [Oryza sativa Japonica Group]
STSLSLYLISSPLLSGFPPVSSPAGFPSSFPLPWARRWLGAAAAWATAGSGPTTTNRPEGEPATAASGRGGG